MLARGSHTDLRRIPYVLVAERDPKLRAEMVAALHEHCEVIEAIDGPDALDKTADLLLAGERMPDAFVLDAGMPHWSGLQMMCSIRGCDGIVPIVLTAACDDRAMQSLSIRCGAVLLEKPFDVRALCGAILEVIREPPPLPTSRTYVVRTVGVERRAPGDLGPTS